MQNYQEIPSSQSLQSSLPLILNNDKTALSCSSGSAFPTSNLQVGMFCFRVDQLKLYQLTDATPTWLLVADYGSGTSVVPQAASVNGWTPVQQGGGVGQGTNKIYIGYATNVLQLQVDTTNFGSNWPISISGTAANATTVNGKTVGNASGNVPLSNGTVNTNLNADMVDGIHAGNAAGQIPVSNGTVNTNLNADTVDGFHGATFVRSVGGVTPDINGDVASKGLHSNGIGGYNASAALSAVDVGRLTYYTGSADGTLTLPPAPNAGDVISVSNLVGVACTISNGANTAQHIYAQANAGVNSITLQNGDSVGLIFDGSNWIQAWTGSAKATASGTVKWTAAGSYTFVVPNGVTTIWASVIGGAGGGGGSSTNTGTGGSGGINAAMEIPLSVTPGQSITITVGGGGGGGSQAPGGTGGTSSVGSLLSVAGGGGGGPGSYSSNTCSTTPVNGTAGSGNCNPLAWFFGVVGGAGAPPGSYTGVGSAGSAGMVLLRW